MCSNEVSFEAGKKRKMENPGDKCKTCGIPVVLKESKFKKEKLQKRYYYTHVLWCWKCKKMYISEKYRVAKPPVDFVNSKIKRFPNGDIQLVDAD